MFLSRFNTLFLILFLTLSTYGSSQYYIIGDSQSFLLDKNSKADIFPSLVRSGIGLKELLLMVENNAVNEDAKAIFISIGVNDSYTDFGIKNLISKLYLQFPNAYLFVIKGSYAWGNVKLTKNLVDKYFIYYSKWSNFGIYVLQNGIGSGDPHYNKIDYERVGKEINLIISKISIH